MLKTKIQHVEKAKNLKKKTQKKHAESHDEKRAAEKSVQHDFEK